MSRAPCGGCPALAGCAVAVVVVDVKVARAAKDVEAVAAKDVEAVAAAAAAAVDVDMAAAAWAMTWVAACKACRACKECSKWAMPA